MSEHGIQVARIQVARIQVARTHVAVQLPATMDWILFKAEKMQQTRSRRVRNAAHRSGRLRRPNRLAHLFRGIMVESMGAAVLIFLYLSVTLSADTPLGIDAQLAPKPADEAQPQQLYPDAQWSPYEHRVAHDSNRPLALPEPPWSTWSR